MVGHFSYVFVQTSQDSLDVDDIGNCFLETCNDSGEMYFLAIRTSLGITRVTEYGPYADGIRLTGVTSTFLQFDYNEKKLNKIIYNFLNNPGRTITQAREMDEDEYRLLMKDLKNPTQLLWDGE